MFVILTYSTMEFSFESTEWSDEKWAILWLSGLFPMGKTSQSYKNICVMVLIITKKNDNKAGEYQNF